MHNSIAIPVFLAIAASACTQVSPSGPPVASIDQENLCEVTSWRHDDVAAACRPGQKVVYLPESFGNEQLPVIFAAVNCDLRHSVALTKGAVACIYAPIKPTPAEPEDESAAKPAAD